MAVTTALPTAPGGGVNADILNAVRSGAADNTNVLKNAGIGSGTAKFRIPDAMVKGTRAPGEKPLDDFDQVMSRQTYAEKSFLASIQKTMSDPASVIDGMNPWSPLKAPLGMLLKNNPMFQMAEAIKNIDKSFQLASPLSQGLLPYDLSAPTMLIYPVYSPLRNRFPRPAGQGKSHEARVLTTIQGSQPGLYGNSSLSAAISELPAGGGVTGANWPNQLPASGSQTAVDVNVPYKFFGLTEAVTWLAQFAGQGFDDIAALASLVLLQEFMLAEERTIVGGTAYALGTGMTVTGTARATVSGETALSGDTQGGISVYLTALNYYGETVASASSGTINVPAGEVVDLTIANRPAGSLTMNVYVASGTTNPGSSSAHLMVQYTGSTMVTLQGALPTTTATPPTADTGTGQTNTYEGVFSILSGWAQTNSGAGYPAGYEAGYINTAVDDILSVAAVDNALRQVYNGSSTSYFADPAEIWTSAQDATNLSKDLVLNGNDLNYTIFVQQSEVSNVIAGIAVSQFTNPVTRSTVRITVHPYWPQGSAVGMSYTLPQVQTNVSNVWEVVCVQDYISINWPVIDVTFRYSIFDFSTLFSPAPMYNFLLQGLQLSNIKPYS